MAASEEDQVTESVKEQIAFTGASSCAAFVHNPFRMGFCGDCSAALPEHAAANVTPRQARDYLAHVASSGDPANLVLAEPAGGMIYLGGYLAAQARFVRSKRVTHIVNAARGLELMFPKWGKGLPHLGASILRLDWHDLCSQRLGQAEPYDDLAMLSGFASACLDASPPGVLLVHCAQGKSRSVTALTALLMIRHGKTVDEALAEIKAVRPIAEPNAGFLRQLRDFEQSDELAALRAQHKRVSAD